MIIVACSVQINWQKGEVGNFPMSHNTQHYRDSSHISWNLLQRYLCRTLPPLQKYIKKTTNRFVPKMLFNIDRIKYKSYCKLPKPPSTQIRSQLDTQVFFIKFMEPF